MPMPRRTSDDLGTAARDRRLRVLHHRQRAQVLGIILMMNGLSLTLGSWQVGWKVLPVIIFQLATAPIAAHMVGRAGYRTDKVRSDLLGVDELTEDLEAARADIQDTQA